ncbi:MAG: hypothetical protein JO295_05880 [Verrucomicrobia bacterium]|nr:hypothetical protein [Verrucomicrobiota bacterium]
MKSLTRFIPLLVFIIGISACSRTQSTKYQLTKYAWQIIGHDGNIQMIYLDPIALDDSVFLSQLVSYLSQTDNVVQLMFFDDLSRTSKQMPMSDDEMLHLKAQYNWNPHTNYERFTFEDVTDANTSPPELTAREAVISRR